MTWCSAERHGSAYPDDVRDALGPEMTGTLLDVSAGSTRCFVREFADLLRLGLWARALLAPASIALLGVALSLALVGCDRLAGAAALVWTAARMPLLLDDNPGMALAVLAESLPPVACFAVLVFAGWAGSSYPRRSWRRSGRRTTTSRRC